MLLFAATLARAEVVDRILHIVGDRVVCASDVAFERAFDPHDASPIAALEDPTYAVERRLLDFAIVREQAADTSLYRPDARDVRLRYEAFRDSFASASDFMAFLSAWGMDETRLQGLISSRLVVERYIVRNALYRHGGDAASQSAFWQAWVAELRARVPVRSPP